MRIRLLAELALLCSAQIPQPRNVAPPLAGAPRPQPLYAAPPLPGAPRPLPRYVAPLGAPRPLPPGSCGKSPIWKIWGVPVGVAPWLFSDAVVCEMQQISAVGLVNLIIFLWVTNNKITREFYIWIYVFKFIEYSVIFTYCMFSIH